MLSNKWLMEEQTMLAIDRTKRGCEDLLQSQTSEATTLLLLISRPQAKSLTSRETEQGLVAPRVDWGGVL